MCVCAITFFTYSGVCLTTLVMCPSPGASLAEVITGQLCALREHITMRTFKVYSRHHPNHIRNREMSKGRSESHVPAKQLVGEGSTIKEVHKIGSNDVSKQLEQSEDDVSHREASMYSVLSSEASFSPVTSPPTAEDEVDAASSLQLQTPSPPAQTAEEALNTQYLNMAEECTNKLVTIAKEGIQDGWLEVGTTKNVHVMKKLPVDKELPINSIKGTGTVNAPPEFLLRFLRDPTNATALDELLKETRVLQELSPAVTLVQLLYKAVWPTSPRDLAVLSIAGQVDPSTWISSGISIIDARIPPEKGYVRADLLAGGYVIHSVPDKPEISEVTYAACVNLKGNIPAFVANKIAESQPMCVDQMRKLTEPFYQQLKDDPQNLAAFEEKFPVPLVLRREEQPPTGLVGLVEDVEMVPSSSSSPLQDRLAHSQWHFEPSQDNSSDPSQVDGIQHSTLDGSSEVHGRFETPPIDSDNERAMSKSSVLEPGMHNSHSSMDKDGNEASSVHKVPNAALQLSQYAATNIEVRYIW